VERGPLDLAGRRAKTGRCAECGEPCRIGALVRVKMSPDAKPSDP